VTVPIPRCRNHSVASLLLKSASSLVERAKSTPTPPSLAAVRPDRSPRERSRSRVESCPPAGHYLQQRRSERVGRPHQALLGGASAQRLPVCPHDLSHRYRLALAGVSRSRINGRNPGSTRSGSAKIRWRKSSLVPSSAKVLSSANSNVESWVIDSKMISTCSAGEERILRTTMWLSSSETRWVQPSGCQLTGSCWESVWTRRVPSGLRITSRSPGAR